MFTSDVLIKLVKCGRSPFRQCIPLGISDACRMLLELLLDEICQQMSSVEQLMTAQCPRFVLFGPVRPLFRVHFLCCLLAQRFNFVRIG